MGIKKYHKLRGLNNKHLFLTVLETGKSKSTASADSVSGENLLPDSQKAIFLLSPYMAGGEGAL